MPEDAAVPEGRHSADEKDEIPDQIHVDETHGNPLKERRKAEIGRRNESVSFFLLPSFFLPTSVLLLPRQADDERGSAIQTPGLFARVIVFRPLFAVADGREAARID